MLNGFWLYNGSQNNASCLCIASSDWYLRYEQFDCLCGYVADFLNCKLRLFQDKGWSSCLRFRSCIHWTIRALDSFYGLWLSSKHHWWMDKPDEVWSSSLPWSYINWGLQIYLLFQYLKAIIYVKSEMLRNIG